ncbi:trichohyalin-like [Daktulosphaira vitifoliae]|uniref:trichohyalin-like n=1 Tax=Daktulosphaira vitifoliae TaxID=58002 RepID=UPI0021AA95B7|nr:trichohyalin-like [Daktulosphaira vitifoliae]
MMYKTLSFTVGILLLLFFSFSTCDVCTKTKNVNFYSEFAPSLSQEKSVVMTRNGSNTYEDELTSYYVKDTYRTGNLRVRVESRRIRIGDDKEGSIRLITRTEDNNRRERLRRSVSLPNFHRQKAVEEFRVNRIDLDFQRRTQHLKESRKVRNVMIENIFEKNRRTDRRSERREESRLDDGRRKESRLDNTQRERRENNRLVDERRERQLNRNVEERKREVSVNQKTNSISYKEEQTSSWPFSNFVQSAIGVLGLYYFGLHNKSIK